MELERYWCRIIGLTGSLTLDLDNRQPAANNHIQIIIGVMGNTAGKNSRDGDDIVDSFQHLSNHDGKLSEREATSAWYRYGVAVTDVYDVVEVLGQGHMGETFTVRRKTTGHHTPHTREQSKDSQSDVLRMAREKEEKEAKKAHKKTISDASKMIIGTPKKLITKGVGKIGSGTKLAGKDANNDEDDHGLSRFIKTDEAIASEAIHEPPKHTAKPVKSIMKDTFGRKFSTSSELSFSIASTDSLSTNAHERLNSIDSDWSSSGDGSGKSKKKGVHFQRTFAVKTILTSRVNSDQLQELVNEIMIMRKLVRVKVLLCTFTCYLSIIQYVSSVVLS